MSDDPRFLETPRLLLRGLGVGDVSPAYVGWLNDAEVLRFRGPKAYPSTAEQASEYVAGVSRRGDLLLGIFVKDGGRHIGNIVLNSIALPHRSAELSVMIGARDTWGHGYGKEAIRAVTCHGFRTMGLNRLWAESPNPAFNRAVERLGWKHEGTKRQAFFVDGGFIDIECWGVLAGEFDGGVGP